MTDTFKSLGDAARAIVERQKQRHLGSPAMQTIERLAREQMERKKKQQPWRPASCPNDEGQFEAAARRRDAREGFNEED